MVKPRYISQKDNYSCGPVAFINLMKWSGENVTYKDINFYKEFLMCDKSGTFRGVFSVAIESLYNLNVKHVSNPRSKDIDGCLDKGGSVVLVYSFYDEDEEDCEAGHFMFVTKKCKKTYLCHNSGKKYSKTNYRWPRRSLLRYLMNNSSDAWLVTKK